MVYKLFWYDKLGNDIEEPGKNWQSLWLNTQEKQIILLVKPTEESENYRVYVKWVFAIYSFIVLSRYWFIAFKIARLFNLKG